MDCSIPDPRICYILDTPGGRSVLVVGHPDSRSRWCETRVLDRFELTRHWLTTVTLQSLVTCGARQPEASTSVGFLRAGPRF